MQVSIKSSSHFYLAVWWSCGLLKRWRHSDCSLSSVFSAHFHLQFLFLHRVSVSARLPLPLGPHNPLLKPLGCRRNINNIPARQHLSTLKWSWARDAHAHMHTGTWRQPSLTFVQMFCLVLGKNGTYPRRCFFLNEYEHIIWVDPLSTRLQIKTPVAVVTPKRNATFNVRTPDTGGRLVGGQQAGAQVGVREHTKKEAGEPGNSSRWERGLLLTCSSTFLDLWSVCLCRVRSTYCWKTSQTLLLCPSCLHLLPRMLGKKKRWHSFMLLLCSTDLWPLHGGRAFKLHVTITPHPN